MAGTILVENNFKDLFNTTALPLLDKVMLDEYNELEDPRSKLFNMESADREIIQHTEIDSLGLFQNVREAEVAPLDSFTQSFNKTYRMLKYAKMIAITKEMVRDEKWGLIGKMVKGIGRSAKEAQMVNAFNVYNNAFSASFPASDGVALISASHPSQIGNQSNTLAAQSDLAESSLKEAERIFLLTQDQVGKRINIMPKVLLVAPFNMHTAQELVLSPFQFGTANNNINSIGRYEVVVAPWLTDTDAWFLQSDPMDHGIRHYARQPLETDSEMDKKAMVLYYVADYREAVGADRWRGIVGSDGSAS
jgi:hypothetical protein